MLPSVLKSRSRLFFAVYPRLTGGLPARLFNFAPDEACISGAVAIAEVGFYPAISPLPDHLKYQ